jgi:hypothetical protein
MNEHDKTPTISHHQQATPSQERTLSKPPYLDGDSSGSSDHNRAQDMSNPSKDRTSSSKGAPQSLTIDTAENRLSGLSGDEEDEPNTPKSCPKKIVIEEQEVGNSTSAPLLPATERIMPPVHEDSVTTNGLPPRTTTNKHIRSPRPRNLKAVDWCPPSYSRVATSTSTTPTVATSRAVRGDDATITTYATMTTMGDAASILEESEDEEESSVESVEDALVLGMNSTEREAMNSSIASGMDSFVRLDDRSVVSGMDLGSIYEHLPWEEEMTCEVDKVPDTSSMRMEASVGGVTGGAVKDSEDRSLYSLNTANTNTAGVNHYGVSNNLVEVDKVPDMTSTPGTSVISGATSKALRDPDDRSLYSLNTTNTAAMSAANHYGAQNNLVEVDKVPDMTSTPGTSVISGATSKALRDPDDRSLYSLNTTNTAAMSVRVNDYDIQNNIVEVDKIPDITSTPGTSVVSGTTTKALRDPDDRSLYSLNTINTGINSNYNYKNTMVDRTPSNVPSMLSGNTQRSLMGDEDSDATFSTMNTTGKERAYSIPSNVNQSNHVVDRIPEKEEASISARTDGAVRNKEDQSVATWNTFITGAMNDASVVDVLPASKHSVISGTTNQAVND